MFVLLGVCSYYTSLTEADGGKNAEKIGHFYILLSVLIFWGKLVVFFKEGDPGKTQLLPHTHTWAWALNGSLHRQDFI